MDWATTGQGLIANADPSEVIPVLGNALALATRAELV